ncbi:hypothetical protein BAUCODRAFT_141483 [Baudoinia panamericana UAMH 10762]|uniref:CID domain-containing protein n=1 Tax=Baudoinia panamericana (strain UAMH 10762) TaxID=717646 RepID=M2N5R1_BAUPA|nr:uncharacterized protein BAUCODRAFT_141483 [Baudoinia panamericana UAMH 10762]EMC94100.1 hypothetical protein BAUCODRAFT_141483 [Baudoinia panamericana UAMH 10762]
MSTTADAHTACTRYLREILGGDADNFITDIQRVANVCTKSNIQRCTAFILSNIITSTAKSTALARYILSLSQSFSPRELGKRIDTTQPDDANTGLGTNNNGRIQQPPQPHLKRLHLLYLVSDALCAGHRISLLMKASTADGGAGLQMQGLVSFQQYLPALAALATYAGNEQSASNYLQVVSILKIWHDGEIVSEAEVVATHEHVLRAHRNTATWDGLTEGITAEDSQPNSKTLPGTRDTKAILPARHGVPNDPTAPWHELPAANGLYMKRTRGYPLRAAALPVGGYELHDRHEGGEALDAGLETDVEALHGEILRAFDKYTNAEDVQDVDALGNVLWKDPDRPTRNYWGWSLDGIDRMKAVAKRDKDAAIGYADVPIRPMQEANAEVDRARAMASERGGGRARGGGRPGWRGGRRW